MLAEPVRHRFTVEEYHQMGETGIFSPDQRLELLGGEVIEMSPIGSRHAGTVNRLNRLFARALGDAAVVTVQNPVRLSDVSEPQPDLMLLRPRSDFYAGGHPTPGDVLLLIEVSDTSAAWDRGAKRPLYAAAGIVEVWVIDLVLGLVEVATNPGPEGYRHVHQVQRETGGAITPGAFPHLCLPTADLLA